MQNVSFLDAGDSLSCENVQVCSTALAYELQNIAGK